MSRKTKDADFDCFMRALGEFPWWAALLLAGIIFVGFEFVVPAILGRMMAHSTTQEAISGMLWFARSLQSYAAIRTRVYF